MRPPPPSPCSARNSDEPQEVRRERAGDRRQREHAERAEQHAAAAEPVAQVAVQRRGDGRREQVADDDPRQVVDAAQRARDRGQRAREDRLVGGGQEHRHHDAREHAPERVARRRRRPRGGPGGRIRRFAQRARRRSAPTGVPRASGRRCCSCDVAPAPRLAGFVRAHHRMAGRVEMPGRMPVLRAVAAADVAAGEAQAQVHPRVARLQAFRAALACGRRPARTWSKWLQYSGMAKLPSGEAMRDILRERSPAAARTRFGRAASRVPRRDAILRRVVREPGPRTPRSHAPESSRAVRDPPRSDQVTGSVTSTMLLHGKRNTPNPPADSERMRARRPRPRLRRRPRRHPAVSRALVARVDTLRRAARFACTSHRNCRGPATPDPRGGHQPCLARVLRRVRALRHLPPIAFAGIEPHALVADESGEAAFAVAARQRIAHLLPAVGGRRHLARCRRLRRRSRRRRDGFCVGWRAGGHDRLGARRSLLRARRHPRPRPGGPARSTVADGPGAGGAAAVATGAADAAPGTAGALIAAEDGVDPESLPAGDASRGIVRRLAEVRNAGEHPNRRRGNEHAATRRRRGRRRAARARRAPTAARRPDGAPCPRDGAPAPGSAAGPGPSGGPRASTRRGTAGTAARRAAPPCRRSSSGCPTSASARASRRL